VVDLDPTALARTVHGASAEFANIPASDPQLNSNYVRMYCQSDSSLPRLWFISFELGKIPLINMNFVLYKPSHAVHPESELESSCHLRVLHLASSTLTVSTAWLDFRGTADLQATVAQHCGNPNSTAEALKIPGDFLSASCYIFQSLGNEAIL
jgi:hypothetical protein